MQDGNRLYGLSEYGEDTFQVVATQIQAHHAALVVDFDSVPFREGGGSIPVCIALPISPTGRVVKGNQCVAVRRHHRRSGPGGSAHAWFFCGSLRDVQRQEKRTQQSSQRFTCNTQSQAYKAPGTSRLRRTPAVSRKRSASSSESAILEKKQQRRSRVKRSQESKHRQPAETARAPTLVGVSDGV